MISTPTFRFLSVFATALVTGVAAFSAPQYGDAGFDVAGADLKTKPGDDFFRYANGTWVDQTPIPADKGLYSLRLAMTDRTEQRLHEIMEQEAARCGHEPKTVAGKVGAFYRSFMDESGIAARGAKPLARHLDEIRAATTREALVALMGRNSDDFFGSLFALGTDIDLKNPKEYAVYVGQAGLSLPDRDYYLEPGFADKKAQFEKYVAELLRLEGWPEAEKSATDVVAFETAIAQVSWTRVQQRDVDATYNPMSRAELQALTPEFSWKAFLASAHLARQDRLIVGEKSAFPKIAAVFADTPIATLQAWLAFTVADNAAPYLAPDFAQASFAMRKKGLSGQQVESERWKLGVHAVSGGDYGAGDHFDRFGNLGWAVGDLYTEKYFPASAKAKIEDLVAHVKAAYRVRIEHLDWMSAPTKAEALKKLDTYAIKVGFPKHRRDYSGVVIRDDDLVGNVLAAARADWAFYVGRLGGPVDRTDWTMTPQTNDAYNGSLRDIVFPAGILQPPIFDPEADPAYNFGAAGGIIGHELTHGFDDEGRKLDTDGRLRDWWTPDDAKVFENRAHQLSAQYSAFEPLPGVHVNGDLTLGENIADLGGVTLALEAYRASLGGKPAPVVDGLTGDQRVFIGWAQAWRGKYRDDNLRKQVVGDPHSPRMYRVNGIVRNIDAWYDVFNVQPGDKLYLAPEDRVRIW
ncbi:MAG TPA: M13 family metallopeptidase [Candidatus Didemnitutus sp.]|nr:M13 family metallopeptidase [Candidatus Didemnitutus sp.]